MGTANKEYDEEGLVLAIAKATKTYGEIGAEFGLCEAHVGRIARGQVRPELQQAIQDAVEGFRDEARRLAAASARPAIARLMRLIASDPEGAAEADVARKAAVDLLKHAVGDPSKPEQNINQNQSQGSPLGLSADDLDAFLKFKADRNGGPPDEGA